MQAMVATILWVFLFPHEGWIVSIDLLSFSHPDPSSGTSTVPMIDNPQPDIVNIGVCLCPALMGTFDYLPLFDDVKFISAVPDQPKAKIFQVSLFHMTYFNDPWTLPSPSSTMEGKGHHGMAMPLFAVEVAYSIVQQASAYLDPTSPQELDLVFKPTWAQGLLATTDSLELVLPSNEAILEALTSPNKPWDDLHHISYFLSELGRIEVGEF
jgi:hypothetical protein